MGTDPRTDRQLVDAINDGDSNAFEALYRRHRDWVVNLAYRFTSDRDASLDVMQETFTYVLNQFPGLQLTAKFTTYCYPIVRSIAHQRFRKLKREQSVDSPPDEIAIEPDEIREDPRVGLASLLSELTDEQRETVLLRFVDGMSLQEIADATDTPLNTVKSRLRLALESLRNDPRTKIYFDR